MAEVSPMSREVALRLALAARALPDIEVREFVNTVAERLGLPITAEKLAGVTVADIKLWLQGDDVVEPAAERSELKQAVRLLWGEGLESDDLPAAAPYAEGEMPGSLRLAIASNSGEQVDGHFGSCSRFLIYQVGVDAYRLIDVRSTLEADVAEDKNVARAALIADCNLAYMQSIGGPAAAKVVRAGVHPIKLPAGGPADKAIARLQTSMLTPPPWLARIMGVEPASLARFAEEIES